MSVKTNFAKLYKAMRRLSVIHYRKNLSNLIPNLKEYNDNQVFELMHAINTHVDIKGLCDPSISSKEMREIRLSREFGTTLMNTKTNNKDVAVDGEETIISSI